MDKFTMCVPCLFGLEGLVRDELTEMGMSDVSAENGRVLFSGSPHELARANIGLRCGERVLVRVGSFHASTPDELFYGVKALPWEKFIPRDCAFPVKGFSLDSQLKSVPNCQKTIKKAAALRLSSAYRSDLPETGAKHQIQFSLMHDNVELYLDSTGAGLHKRGYRPEANAAPLRETLAAALCRLARYDAFRPFYDPMCGSGTIAIEAALIASGRAPGLSRAFDAEKWPIIPHDAFRSEREAAISRIKPSDGIPPIFCSDTDPACVRLTEDNARRAGVLPLLKISRSDALAFDWATADPGTLIVNPPYGERLGDIAAARTLYEGMGQAFEKAPLIKKFIISSDPEFEAHYGRKADKRRKLYNGMIRCDLFMYTKRPFTKERAAQ